MTQTQNRSNFTPNPFTDKQESILWAKDLVSRDNWRILDCETTGLGNDAEICQITIIDPLGQVLLNTLVNPSTVIPREATAVHGISDDTVFVAPRFDQVFLNVLKAVS